MTPPRVLGGVATLVVILAAVIGGWVGVVYVAVYVAATLPGWPLGRMLLGRGHPGAWISGAVLGYSLTALALWVPIAVGAAWWLPFLLAWGVAVAATWLACRAIAEPAVDVPRLGRDGLVALGLALLLVLAIVWLPYSHIGQLDDTGSRRYRAYFTADFVWHEALTAELARFSSPPRNPYLTSEPLHYYWTYYLLPATVTGVTGSPRTPPPIETYLAINALLTGVMFVATIFLAAWSAVPRAVPAGAATALALAASSAEGLYATVDLVRRGRSLDGLRHLNIDAITLWFFQGLTVDGLVRSILYNPQHSLACALGLVALTIGARGGATPALRAAATAGLALGLALMMSPFLGGALTLAYALSVLWNVASDPRALVRAVVAQALSAALVLAALGWCIVTGTFEGAGRAVAFGLSRTARREPLTIIGLALGPVLLPAMLGIGAAAFNRFPRWLRPQVAVVALALALFYFVTLRVEPIWIGWRAGQLFLVAAPGLIAFAIAQATDRVDRRVVAAAVALLFAVGLPTTLVDVYNAQDTSNLAMGPGFHWTVVVTPGELQMFRWIQRQTPPDAVVQMSIGPRGRETWSLIPSFARRRMAAGQPISLLHTPSYDEASARADRVYASGDPLEAWRTARDLRIDYLYVGRVEHEAFGAGAAKFEARPDLFTLVFANGDAAVYRIGHVPVQVIRPAAVAVPATTEESTHR